MSYLTLMKKMIWNNIGMSVGQRFCDIIQIEPGDALDMPSPKPPNNAQMSGMCFIGEA